MNHNTERTYRVDKNHLLGILETNRTKHVETFKAAVKAYRSRSLLELERRIAKVNSGANFDLTFTLPQPINYKKQYDSIIGLLKMSTETSLQITHNEYKQWVEDEWNWNHSFFANTSSYVGAAAVNASDLPDLDISST